MKKKTKSYNAHNSSRSHGTLITINTLGLKNIVYPVIENYHAYATHVTYDSNRTLSSCKVLRIGLRSNENRINPETSGSNFNAKRMFLDKRRNTFYFSLAIFAYINHIARFWLYRFIIIIKFEQKASLFSLLHTSLDHTLIFRRIETPPTHSENTDDRECLLSRNRS